jgi:hypothetical protein
MRLVDNVSSCVIYFWTDASAPWLSTPLSQKRVLIRSRVRGSVTSVGGHLRITRIWPHPGKLLCLKLWIMKGSKSGSWNIRRARVVAQHISKRDQLSLHFNTSQHKWVTQLKLFCITSIINCPAMKIYQQASNSYQLEKRNEELRMRTKIKSSLLLL